MYAGDCHPCIYISLRMGMDPKKTGRRGRERRERQGGYGGREKRQGGYGGRERRQGGGVVEGDGPERKGGIAGEGEMGRGRELH